MEEDKSQNINAVKRAAIIIETLSHGSLGVRELARLTSYDKSTISRTLLTLETAGFVSRSNQNGKYMLTYKIFEIGNRSLSSFEFRVRLEPHLQELNKMTKETVMVGVLLQGDVLILRKLKALPLEDNMERDLDVVSEIGYRVPLYNTALGKAILAFIPAAQREALIEKILYKKTAKNTIKSKEEMLREIALVQQAGYAVNDEELKNDIKAVAAPFYNYRNEVVGAVTITASSYRMDPERIKKLGALIVKYGKKISFDLAYHY